MKYNKRLDERMGRWKMMEEEEKTQIRTQTDGKNLYRSVHNLMERHMDFCRKRSAKPINDSQRKKENREEKVFFEKKKKNFDVCNVAAVTATVAKAMLNVYGVVSVSVTSNDDLASVGFYRFLHA